MAIHKGVRFKIRIPDGDILIVSSLELHYLLKYGGYREPKANPDEYHEIIKLVSGEYPDVEILAVPITEYEDDEPESNDCS